MKKDDCIMKKDEYVIIEKLVKHGVHNCDFRSVPYLLNSDCYIISDPPYNQNFNYGTYKDNLDPVEYAELLKAAFNNPFKSAPLLG